MIGRSAILVMLFAVPGLSQRIEVGARVGTPVTRAFDTGSEFHIDFGEGATSATRRYTVGPMIGVRLPHRLSLELDALYKPLGFDQQLKSFGLVSTHIRTTADSWEFPVLAKFRLLPSPALSPYVAGGVSFRHISRVSTFTEQTFNLNTPVRSAGSNSEILAARSGRGGVVGVGVELHLAFLHFSPEFRFTHWGGDRNPDPLLHSHQNQAEVLLGIAF
jgi:hypothetical protein